MKTVSRTACTPAAGLRAWKSAQDAAGKRGSEIGLQHQRDSHGHPVAAVPAQSAGERVPDGDAGGEPDGVTKGGGPQGEVGPQNGEHAGEAQAPGLGGLPALEFLDARLTGVSGKFDG